MYYPLRFQPVYFDKVWGGRRLETILGRTIPAGQPIGESWEVSDHPHGRSIVSNGPDKGETLHTLISRDPAGIMGTRLAHANSFPLLVKYIDAEDKLSVQVHPDDAYAAEHEGELGKTEMWYVLHADPGATLIVGLQDGVTAEMFRQALTHGDPASLLREIPVQTGDSVFIPSGLIHAIMPGVLILEIQQNSDTTYRLYDWGRLGLDGKPRTLHIEQALAVTQWEYTVPDLRANSECCSGINRHATLASCPYFVVEKYDLVEEHPVQTDGGSCYILNCVGGEGTLLWDDGSEPLTFGDSLLIPAAIGNFTLQPSENMSVVLSYVP